MKILKSVVILTYDLLLVHTIWRKWLNISNDMLAHIIRYLSEAILNKTNFAPTKTYLI